MQRGKKLMQSFDCTAAGGNKSSGFFQTTPGDPVLQRLAERLRKRGWHNENTELLPGLMDRFVMGFHTTPTSSPNTSKLTSLIMFAYELDRFPEMESLVGGDRTKVRRIKKLADYYRVCVDLSELLDGLPASNRQAIEIEQVC